jgi:RNA polymerase sigma-70 factor (ECF subfamily)
MTATEINYQLIHLQDSLMRYACSLTADKDDAKDLVQETNLKVMKSTDKFVIDSSFKAWTYTIMKNTFINNYRSNARQNIYRNYVMESFLSDQSGNSKSNDPHSAYSVKEINQNIDQLKDIFRIPLKMHINGYKYQEIADALDLNIGTVKSRIFFSRKLLKERLRG